MSLARRRVFIKPIVPIGGKRPNGQGFKHQYHLDYIVS